MCSIAAQPIGTRLSSPNYGHATGITRDIISIGRITGITANPASIIVRNFHEEPYNRAAGVCAASSSRTNCLHAIVVFFPIRFLYVNRRRTRTECEWYNRQQNTKSEKPASRQGNCSTSLGIVQRSIKREIKIIIFT